jgi:hypothetical protein
MPFSGPSYLIEISLENQLDRARSNWEEIDVSLDEQEPRRKINAGLSGLELLLMAGISGTNLTSPCRRRRLAGEIN